MSQDIDVPGAYYCATCHCLVFPIHRLQHARLIMGRWVRDYDYPPYDPHYGKPHYEPG